MVRSITFVTGRLECLVNSVLRRRNIFSVHNFSRISSNNNNNAVPSGCVKFRRDFSPDFQECLWTLANSFWGVYRSRATRERLWKEFWFGTFLLDICIKLNGNCYSFEPREMVFLLILFDTTPFSNSVEWVHHQLHRHVSLTCNCLK